MAITFTLDDIRAAYRATGLKPVRAWWIWRNSGTDDRTAYIAACPIGALLTKRCGRDRVSAAVANFALSQLARAELGLTVDELDSFVAGVDDHPHSKYADPAAYSLGRIIWAAVRDIEAETKA